MEPITAIMLILGCDHSMMVCRESTDPIREYQTAQACEQDVESRVREIDNYPVAIAKCIEVPASVAGEAVSVSWSFDRAGNLMAQASTDAGRMTAKVDRLPIETAAAEM